MYPILNKVYAYSAGIALQTYNAKLLLLRMKNTSSKAKKQELGVRFNHTLVEIERLTEYLNTNVIDLRSAQHACSK